MDLKEQGNVLYVVGTTRAELGGSHLHLVLGTSGGRVPHVDFAAARRIFERLHQAIAQGLVRSCHDLSEGGLAVALGEMVFAGEVGAEITSLRGLGVQENDTALLFSESASRFIVEVEPAKVAAFEACWPDSTCLHRLGQTVKEPRLRVAGASGEWVIWATAKDMKEAWQRPLRW
jgi:phosphoribosylformylglycinamidine (FGAM) synthase-like enzyme